MAVPEHIRKVSRPTNTVVVDTKSNSPLRYIVRSRLKSVYKDGRATPRNGPVIGYIYHGRFVAKDEAATASISISAPSIPHEASAQTFGSSTSKKSQSQSSKLSYGMTALAHKHSQDLYEMLLQCFPKKDCNTIMALALAKVERPNLPLVKLNACYKQSFSSIFYPNAKLTKKPLTDLIDFIGFDKGARDSFARLRVERAQLQIKQELKSKSSPQDNLSSKTKASASLSTSTKNPPFLIASTAKSPLSNNTATHTLDSLSNLQDQESPISIRSLSLVYLYSSELQEPLCADLFDDKDYPDESKLVSFIHAHKLKEALVIADLENSANLTAMKEQCAPHCKVELICPIKPNELAISALNDVKGTNAHQNNFDTQANHVAKAKANKPTQDYLKLIKEHDLLNHTRMFNIGNKVITYKQVTLKDSSHLYCFKDYEQVLVDSEANYKKLTKFYADQEIPNLTDITDLAGTIIFNTKENVDPQLLFRAYHDRSLLEMVFNFYNNEYACAPQDEYKIDLVRGFEFINTIAAIITCRIIKEAGELGLLDEMSYGEIKELLESIDYDADGTIPPQTDSSFFNDLDEEQQELLLKFGLCATK